MVVRLPPLEFTDCVTDSPYFRENLHAHERELQKTSQQIKRLIKEVKDLIHAAKRKYFVTMTEDQSIKMIVIRKSFLVLILFYICE